MSFVVSVDLTLLDALDALHDLDDLDDLDDLVDFDFLVDRVLLEDLLFVEDRALNREFCDDFEQPVDLDPPQLFDESVSLDVALDRDEESSSSMSEDLRFDAEERCEGDDIVGGEACCVVAFSSDVFFGSRREKL